MGVGGAAEEVVEHRVASDRDRGGGDRPAGLAGAWPASSAPRRGCGRSRRRRRSSAPRRRPVRIVCSYASRKPPRSAARALRARGDRHLVAAPQVAADLLAVAHPALRRQLGVGDLDDVALASRGRAEARAEPVADEDADEPGGGEVERRRVERGGCGQGRRSPGSRRARPRRRAAPPESRGRSAGPAARRPAWRMRRVCVTPSASRNSGERKNSSPAAASPRSASSSAATVAPAPAHSSRSAAAARNSSGRTPQTSQSASSPSRRRCERIVPSWRQPRLVTTLFAASL